jgi:hypothetical protein
VTSPVRSIGLSTSGHSTVSKAGIGIGASLAGVAVTASVICFVWLQRRRARTIFQASATRPNSVELPGKSKRQSELSTMKEPQETSGGGFGGAKVQKFRQIAETPEPAELESGWAGWEVPTTADIRVSSIEHTGSTHSDEERARGAAGSQVSPTVSPLIS